MIKLVTLDVTNTVIRVLRGVGHQYASIATIYGVKTNPSDIDRAFRNRWKEHNVNYPNFGYKDDMKSHAWWSELAKKCFIDCGCKDEAALTKIATHLYLYFKSQKGWEVLPGTREVLHKIKESDVKLGIISNFDERLEEILCSLDLMHYFDFVLASKQFGHAKPSSSIYEKALDLGQVGAPEALHVGDNVENDYNGPRKVGMSSLLLLSDLEKVPPGVDKAFVISELSNVLKLIEKK